MGFPDGSVVNNLPANAGNREDAGLISGMGRCSGGEIGNPLQYSCLGDPMIYADIPVQLPEASTHVQELYQEWLDGTDSPRVQEALHTAYQGPGQPADSRDIKW